MFLIIAIGFMTFRMGLMEGKASVEDTVKLCPGESITIPIRK